MMAMEATIFTGWIYDHLLPHAEKVKIAHPLMPRASCRSQAQDRFDAAKIADSLGNTQQVLLDTYSKVLEDDDVARVGGRTVEQFAQRTRREVCGPLPGDADFEVVEFTAVEASALTGMSVNALGARCARGTLPSRTEAGKYICL